MAAIDNLELEKRRMFNNLSPDEYNQLVDYQKEFTGIEPLNVNRGVTAADVLRATGPLSQPVAPGLTSSVAQFNDFLANILGAKTQRIAQEEGIGAEQDAAARAAVDASLAKPGPNEKDYFIEVNNQLVDTRTLNDDDPRIIDFRNKEAAEKQTIKLTGGVEMTMEQFNSYSQADKNKLLGLDEASGQTFKESFIKEDGSLGAIIEDANGNITTVDFDVELQPKAEDDGSTETERLLERKTNLQVKKSNEGLSEKEEFELANINQELSKRPYETQAEKSWGTASQELILDLPNREKLLTDVARVSNLLQQSDTNTGILTPALTFVQEIFEPFGVDFKGLTDLVGFETLNAVEDSALIDSISSQLGIAASEQLAGTISERELVALFNTTIRLGAPKEFNAKFAQGLLYLAQKSIYASEAAVTAKSAQEWAGMMKEYQKSNPPPAFMQPIYDFEAMADLDLDVNLRLPLKDSNE